MMTTMLGYGCGCAEAVCGPANAKANEARSASVLGLLIISLP